MDNIIITLFGYTFLAIILLLLIAGFLRLLVEFLFDFTNVIIFCLCCLAYIINRLHRFSSWVRKKELPEKYVFPTQDWLL